MAWLVHILVNAVVLLIASKLMRGVYVRNFTTALIVALIIGVLSFLLGWLLTTLLNLATLGIFYFLGLGIVTRTIANAIVIEITDQLSKGFKTEGFLPSLWLAIILAIVGSLVNVAYY